MTELEAQQLEHDNPDVEAVLLNNHSKQHVVVVGKGDNKSVHFNYLDAVKQINKTNATRVLAKHNKGGE